MGFFYGKEGGSDGYVDKINDIHYFGTPKDLVSKVEMMWMVALRLSDYNPLKAKNILNECTPQEIYEAYLIYSFDKIPDDA